MKAAKTDWACLDGNEAVARVAHALSEVIAIYPITPASSMGEFADTWSSEGRANVWGVVPEVVEMQSEAGAAGTLHGATLKGSLATTFTSSQGLLLMIPNMLKMAGELTPAVIHVAARAVAAHALSIFGDHSDVMAARSTGFALLAASSVQEAHDLAAVAHAATLESRVPFLHFFDGFRTSHEVDRIAVMTEADLRNLIDPQCLLGHRARGLSPDHPVLRGSSQNPDVFFQSREASNPYYIDATRIVQDVMDRLATTTGRQYRLVDYYGAPDAERVLVLMGSAAGAAQETVEALNRVGQRVGVAVVRLYRPFPADALLAALPATTQSIAVLDRTKEPGAIGEPLYLDVVAALAEGQVRTRNVVGARYGLASKELTPAMLKGLFDELDTPAPRRHVTLGINDDLTHLSVKPDHGFTTDHAEVRAVFYGLGADGTVGAAKQTVKIIGEQTGRYAQGYFVYDSKKAGTVTVSHVRVDDDPIRSTYLIEQAGFVACHQWQFLDRLDVLDLAEPGATFLLNAPHGPDDVWEHLPADVQQAVVDKDLDLWVVDAYKLASDIGLGRRINTIMQTCFFALTGVLGEEDPTGHIKAAVAKAYGKRGEETVARNEAAVDAAVAALHRVARRGPVNGRAMGAAPTDTPALVKTLLAFQGDDLPVSMLPADGRFPTGTTKYEKRDIARQIPVWDPELCTDCAKCTIVCPHAALRMKVFEPAAITHAPDSFQSKLFRSKDLAGHLLSIQVAPDDCTGCQVCVEVCPAHDKADPSRKALFMADAEDRRPAERVNWDFFLDLPELDPAALPADTLKGSQVRRPLFEFSGACAGCGETPYLKLLTQLFGDRAVVANATGCSSIYGGNLPTTPWAKDDNGRGPAWANSLFEDNAEFGFGLRIAADHQRAAALGLVDRLAPCIGHDLADRLLSEEDPNRLRADVAQLKRRLAAMAESAPLDECAAQDVMALRAVADELVHRSVWIVGGDGWAYDIGFGGLDHVLASGRNVNILVLDTEVYSNTGGQASKATPRGAVARFAAAGKPTAKKNLALMAMAYGNVYVAQVSMGGNDIQTVKAFAEADAWPGPSIIIAYASCSPAHGYDESQSMNHQRDAVRSGYWPLFRYRPDQDQPFKLDSRPAAIALRDFALSEDRFASLARSDPERAESLLRLSEEDAEKRLRLYRQMEAVTAE